jgi:hypothetical protein
VWAATITIADHGHGPIAFGTFQAGLDIESSRSSGRLHLDEMDEVSGNGSAELLDDSSIEFEFAYHSGEEAVLKAQRDSSTPYEAPCRQRRPLTQKNSLD